MFQSALLYIERMGGSCAYLAVLPATTLQIISYNIKISSYSIRWIFKKNINSDFIVNIQSWHGFMKDWYQKYDIGLLILYTSSILIFWILEILSYRVYWLYMHVLITIKKKIVIELRWILYCETLIILHYIELKYITNIQNLVLN